MKLIDYGFVPAMVPENESGIPARVTSVHRERYELVCEHGTVYGVLKPAVYFQQQVGEHSCGGRFRNDKL